jgi:hypothetical protein
MSKGFLRGLSTGIIFTTALFTIYLYPLNDMSWSPQGQSLNKEAISAYLKENGQIAMTNDEYNHLKQVEEQNTELQNELTRVKKGQAEDQKVDETQSSSDPSANPEENSEVIKYTLEIKQGMTGPNVSGKLEEVNIIESATELSDYLLKQGWEGSIQVGTFELASTLTIEEIARIITKNP